MANLQRLLIAAVVGFLLVLSDSSASAASLRVAPVVLDLKAPASAATLRVWNDEKRPINVQIRIFRWTQRNGVDVYEPTSDVVASPPISKLQPGGENIIRIVRTTKRNIQTEESYRVIVDELPDASRRQNNTVVMVVRHSIPVFFGPEIRQGADPSWSVRRVQGGYQVTVKNRGSQRLKLFNMTLNNNGRVVAKHDGLVGYVLANGSASWIIPGQSKSSAGPITISVESEKGRFNATASSGGI